MAVNVAATSLSLRGPTIASQKAEADMDSGYYAACTGLRAQNQALELIANNLANLNTIGYRGQSAVFQSLVAGESSGMTEINYAINDFNVMDKPTFDLTAGGIQRSGNPLDLAIEGDAFFMVKSAEGIVYTRAGNFELSPAGKLVTSSGDPVLGVQGPITLPAGDIAVSGDGTISVHGALVDQLQIVRFPGDVILKPVGSSYYSAGASAPLPASASHVRQGMIEVSNVNAAKAVVQLITVQRQAEMLQRALSVFYTNFNQTAASDLPRVS
jgi:flagellar basal-body rod protein FlgF